MTIPATRDEASDLNLLIERLIQSTMPFVGFIEGDKIKPTNATGVVVHAPDAPYGAVVLTAGHVASHANRSGYYGFFVPSRDGESTVPRTSLYLREVHRHLDVASFEFCDGAPSTSWKGLESPSQNVPCFTAGFRSNFADWKSDSEVDIGRSAFLLRTISDGPVAQLSLASRARPGNLFGLSGSPVWRLKVTDTKDGINLLLVGLIKGGDEKLITLHAVYDLQPDGSWR